MRILFAVVLFSIAPAKLFAADDPVVDLAKKKEWAAVLAAVEKDPSAIHQADAKSGNTVLHWAILDSNVAAVEGLLRHSKLKSVDGMKSKFGATTPLHLAALMGEPAIFKAVLAVSQHVNEKAGDNTALIYAVNSRKLDHVLALLDKGADPEIPNSLGQRPLHLSLLAGSNDISKLLIAKGVDVRVTALKQTPLQWAVLSSSKEICELLIARDKTLVNLAGDEGDTPLHVAAEQGEVELTKLLLKHGADSWVKNKKGRSAIDIAEEKWKKTKEQKFSQVLSLLGRL